MVVGLGDSQRAINKSKLHSKSTCCVQLSKLLANIYYPVQCAVFETLLEQPDGDTVTVTAEIG